MVGIETWVNERYVRDISRKIRASLRFKIQKGEYLGKAPFGYRKSCIEKNRLVIDESEAYIVRLIYRLYLSGMGYTAISKYLEEKGYGSPRNKGWNRITVRRILCSRVYIGDTVQGVSEKVSFKSKKTRRLPESRWVITEGTHDALIPRKMFDEVQALRQSRAGAGKCRGGSGIYSAASYSVVTVEAPCMPANGAGGSRTFAEITAETEGTPVPAISYMRRRSSNISAVS